VLRALGLAPERIRGAVRFGLGRGTSEAEIDLVIGRVVEEVMSARTRDAAGPVRVHGG
jgi:cysteine sulfinate desulfinase/cysteine desulfurase-like protein